MFLALYALTIFSDIS